MIKLHDLAKRMPSHAVLTNSEAEQVKGGKRFRTTDYGVYQYVKSVLQSYGIPTQSRVHGSEYCLEW